MTEIERLCAVNKKLALFPNPSTAIRLTPVEIRYVDGMDEKNLLIIKKFFESRNPGYQVTSGAESSSGVEPVKVPEFMKLSLRD